MDEQKAVEVPVYRVGSLADALSKAQGEMGVAKRNAENPFFKHGYADLAAIWEACRGPITKHGLSVTQTTVINTDGGLVLITRLLHSSGEFIDSLYPVNPVKSDPQGIGSAMTYARRYSLAAIVGVSVEGEDDDANAASGKKQDKVEQPKTQMGKAITDAQRKRLFAIAKEHGVDEVTIKNYLSVEYKIDSTSKIQMQDYDAIVNWISANDEPGAQG